VFTDELQNVEGLARAIREEASRHSRGESTSPCPDGGVVPPGPELPAEPSGADSPGPDARTQEDRLAEFNRTLAELTPRVYVTPLLVGVNVLVFALMVLSGVNPVDPTIPDLLRWGADFGPQSIGGEWWRLLTCIFVHIGIVHILFNMWVLIVAGPLVERMIGNVGFLLLYLFAGLCGSLASLFWNPMLVSAGASGAIFGIYGALLGLLLPQYRSIPAGVLAQLRNSGLGFLLYNLLFGLINPHIDSAAHIGGLIGGFFCGMVLSQPFTAEALARRTRRNCLAALLGTFLVLAGMIGVSGRLPDGARVPVEVEQFAAVEKKALDTFNDAVAKMQRREMTEAAFADVLERDVLPPWRAAQERLRGFREIPAAYQAPVTALLEYMTLRQEAWDLMVQALREGNDQKWEQAAEKQQRADAVAQRMAKSGGK
jgi:rhomboid protease GluP